MPERSGPAPLPHSSTTAALRRWRRTVLALGMGLLLSLFPLVPGGRAASVDPGASAASAPASAAPPASQGAYRLGKVRILGVPVITVASPVVQTRGVGPDAETRAEVIEGNLEMLYRARTLCSRGEALAEWLVQTFLRMPGSEACGLANASLLGRPEALRVIAVPTVGGLHRLEARVPGRSEPLPLLTVTQEDARLNGFDNPTLTERWRSLLEERLRLARMLLAPRALQERFLRVSLVVLALVALVISALGLWQACTDVLGRLEARYGLEIRPGRHWLTIHALHALSRILLAGVMVLLVAIAGVATFAVPGQVPTALDLLLQPWGIAMKLLVVWAATQAGRVLLDLGLRQWAGNVNVPADHRERRRKRHRTLQRVLRRLVDLAGLLVAGLWILTEMPGVRALPGHAVLVSGALLGALAIVFQGLLRDFVAGLVILFDDRYAIGDSVEIAGMSGVVVDLGVLSTELRAVDHRLAVFQNSHCGEVINQTKLRSGLALRLLLSHRCRQPRRALAVIAEELQAFAGDPAWQSLLLEPPILQGIADVTPQGLTVSMLLVTAVGVQEAAGRELRLRLVERLLREGLPLAEAPEEGAARET
jgi:small conductance mechanosensitive channel